MVAVEQDKREFLMDNLLVRIHFSIVMMRWTGLAPWQFEFPFASRTTWMRCRSVSVTEDGGDRLQVLGFRVQVSGFGVGVEG